MGASVAVDLSLQWCEIMTVPDIFSLFLCIDNRKNFHRTQWFYYGFGATTAVVESTIVFKIKFNRSLVIGCCKQLDIVCVSVCSDCLQAMNQSSIIKHRASSNGR